MVHDQPKEALMSSSETLFAFGLILGVIIACVLQLVFSFIRYGLLSWALKRLERSEQERLNEEPEYVDPWASLPPKWKAEEHCEPQSREHVGLDRRH